MKLRKILALMMAGSLVLGLAGCGNGDENETPKADAGVSDSENEGSDNDNSENTDTDNGSSDVADKVTVEDLVDVLLGDVDEDYSYVVNMELEFEYVETYEGTYKAYYESKYKIDNDKSIKYVESSADVVVELVGFDTQVNESESKYYEVELEDGSEQKIQWDAENEKWVSGVSADEDSSEEDREELIDNAKMTEEDGKYILTINCSSKDMGLDMTSIILGSDADKTVECGVDIVASIDKDSMKLTSMEVDFDVDDINESLTDMIMRCTKFTMLNDDIQYKDIELALPDGF